MNDRLAPSARPRRGVRQSAAALGLVLGLATALAPSAHAERVSPPRVPADLEVDEGSVPFLVGHAVGTQNYVCLPSASSTTGFAWTLFTPEATLFDHRFRQLTTHFFSPNPLESGTVRPAWQHSRDTSTVWAKLNTPSTDARYVAPGAIPWLLLDVAGAAAGPKGGHALLATTQIHRVNTVGGVAPETGCAVAQDVGNKAFVPYTADYFFYAQPQADEDTEE